MKLKNKQWCARTESFEENFVVVHHVCTVLLMADDPLSDRTGAYFHNIDVEQLKKAKSPWHYLVSECEHAEQILWDWMRRNRQ